jgi:hypothetical protein
MIALTIRPRHRLVFGVGEIRNLGPTSKSKRVKSIYLNKNSEEEKEEND